MRIKAALYNADHMEYGLVTIPFPIPRDQYLEAMEELTAYWEKLQNTPQQDDPSLGDMSL